MKENVLDIISRYKVPTRRRDGDRWFLNRRITLSGILC